MLFALWCTMIIAFEDHLKCLFLVMFDFLGLATIFTCNNTSPYSRGWYPNFRWSKFVSITFDHSHVTWVNTRYPALPPPKKEQQLKLDSLQTHISSLNLQNMKVGGPVVKQRSEYRPPAATRVDSSVRCSTTPAPGPGSLHLDDFGRFTAGFSGAIGVFLDGKI